jgi:hypothetical protein
MNATQQVWPPNLATSDEASSRQWSLLGNILTEFRTPVDVDLALARQPRLEQLQEYPLRPFHVADVSGC